MKKISNYLWRTKIHKITSIILVFCIATSTLVQPIAADEKPLSPGKQHTVNGLDLSAYTTEEIPSQLAERLIDEGSQVKSKDGAKASSEIGAVLTPDSADDLTSLTMKNPDGSKTLHRYFEDIKFIDKAGKICFKDNGLHQSSTRRTLLESYAFENGTNNVKTYFPKKISNGLKIEVEDIEISMKPVKKAAEKTEKTNEKVAVLTKATENQECVEYAYAFGSGTSLQYIPLGTGVKENLVLAENPDQYEFSFELNLGTLQPQVMEGESISLLDPKTGEQAALLHPVDMKDSYKGDAEIPSHTSLNNLLRLESTEKKRNLHPDG